MKTTHLYPNLAVLLLLFTMSWNVQQMTAQASNNPFELTPRIPTASTTAEAEAEATKEETTNPFEIKTDTVVPIRATDTSPEIESPTAEEKTPLVTTPSSKPTTTVDKNAATTNPFDIVASPAVATPSIAAPTPKPSTTTDVAGEAVVNPSLLNGIILTMLVLLAALATLFRSALTNSINAFLNDNLLGQVYRDQSSGLTIPYLSFYLLYLLSAGIFVFLIARYFDVSLLPKPYGGILGTILVVGGILLLKLLVLWGIGKIYPISKETKLYSFTVTIFSIVCGLLLIPTNILLAYASEEVIYYTIWGIGIVLGLVYLLRALRGMVIANRFLLFHKFHFLLYICTVEIAPVIILIKLLR